MNSLVPMAGNMLQNTRNAITTTAANSTNSTTSGGFMGSGLMWFVVFVIAFLIVIVVFYEQIMSSMQGWIDSISLFLTGTGSPPEPPSMPAMPVDQPMAPQDRMSAPPTGMEAMVEKVLPPAKEVFTVSKNDYTYYDAAPLCKALGAELATYDQVKAAWQKGADWCNYGWVKGQMAVYPTQKSTYEELQQGPADQRGVCGKPGLNGGYFDNPELRYGVTCVGKRPNQTQHDATAITSGSTRPLSASGIEFEKKIMRFKEQADTIDVLPFNKSKWTS